MSWIPSCSTFHYKQLDDTVCGANVPHNEFYELFLASILKHICCLLPPPFFFKMEMLTIREIEEDKIKDGTESHNFTSLSP